MEKQQAIVQDLLTWYQENKRDLPWRINKDAYRIWVSEIMLQQTRVEAVKPYYERFMTTLPTLVDLAKANDDVLHKSWEGLGYYSRVRNMKKAAITCMDEYDGKLPRTYDQLITLAGIGPYTAGAIASIAYQEKVAAIDGNVLRVLSRIRLLYEDILKETTKKEAKTYIESILPDGKSDEFNQAIMELGALICIPNGEPKCDACPLSQHCKAFQQGKQLELPVKKAKKARKLEERTILIFLYKDKVFLHKRGEGLLAHLYEFVNIDKAMDKKDVAAYTQSMKMKVTKVIECIDSKHIFSHIEWKMKNYIISIDEEFTWMEGEWVELSHIQEQYSIPTAFKVARDALSKYTGVTL